MTVYHGSNVTVKSPRIIEAKRFLDFGAGFYTTTDFEQAKKWAIRKTNVTANGQPTINVFNFDESTEPELKVLCFDSPTQKWLDFVCNNRKGLFLPNQYDVIIGPVANDNTIRTVNDYLSGYLPAEMAIQLLLTQRLKDQYTFKTEKSLQAITFKEMIFV